MARATSSLDSRGLAFQIGGFRLHFEKSGRLAALHYQKRASLLLSEKPSVDMDRTHSYRPGGWDECFPTIEACPGSPVLGDLLWFTPSIRRHHGTVEQVWTFPRYRAARIFRARTNRELLMTFQAANLSKRSIRFLWASHAIFSVQNLDRVVFPDGTTLNDFSVDGSSSKTFKLNQGPVHLLHGKHEVLLETDQKWWGIWLNRGGWPLNRPTGFACLGIEATNCNADLPKDATLAPRSRFEGTVRLRILT